MSVDVSRTLCLEPSREAPSTARHALREFPGGLDADMLSTAELLVSELVTNAVTHGTGMVSVSISCHESMLAVEVADGCSRLPSIRPEEPFATGGRGLRMVALLAGEWGVRQRRDAPGKTVWFNLPLTA